MKPVFLVARSGERPFPAGLAPSLEVVQRVTHSIETLDPASPAGTFDIAIVTSRAAADRLRGRSELARVAGPVLAVGPATARRLRENPSLEVEEGGGSARRLLDAMPRDLSKRRILLPAGDDASDELPRELAARGAEVVRLVLYRKVARPRDETLDGLLESGRVAAFCPTSPSAARWLLGGTTTAAVARLQETPAVVLGDSTAEALASLGVARVEIADPPTFETVAAIATKLAAGTPPE